MNNNSLNGTSATSTNSTITTYNISNTCKYRLPCGWCDRRNCMCTYSYGSYSLGVGSVYATPNNYEYEQSLATKISSNTTLDYKTDEHHVDGFDHTKCTTSETIVTGATYNSAL